MYDDLLGPRKTKKKIPYDSGCDQENKPAQPEKFDSHKADDPEKDHWADVDSDVGKDDIDDQIEDLLMEEDEVLEECEGGDACDSCGDTDCTANGTDPA